MKENFKKYYIFICHIFEKNLDSTLNKAIVEYLCTKNVFDSYAWVRIIKGTNFWNYNFRSNPIFMTILKVMETKL